jgi:hypothetical protein
MRKLFWCAAAGAVVLAAGVYMAADYVHAHPDSVLASCVTAAWRVGVSNSPLGRFGGCTERDCCPGVSDDDADAAGPSEPCPERLQPVPAGEDCEDCEVLLPQTAPPQILEPPDCVLPVLPVWPDDEEHFRPMLPCSGADRGAPEACEAAKRSPPPCCKEECPGKGQCPACPQMGSCCPHSGKCVPQGPADEPELIPPPRKAPGPSTGPAKSTSWKVAPAGSNSPCWCSPGIDTLEFRPSDAKKGEFDPIWH